MVIICCHCIFNLSTVSEKDGPPITGTEPGTFGAGLGQGGSLGRGPVESGQCQWSSRLSEHFGEWLCYDMAGAGLNLCVAARFV